MNNEKLYQIKAALFMLNISKIIKKNVYLLP